MHAKGEPPYDLECCAEEFVERPKTHEEMIELILSGRRMDDNANPADDDILGTTDDGSDPKDSLEAESAKFSSEEKIRLLETLADADDPSTINGIISMLDDSDIRVRGEAFSTLMLSRNNISDALAKSLDSPSEYVRGFAALILANREECGVISEIIRLAQDSSSMVRSCAAGALGFLNAHDAKDVIHELIQDSSREVRRSALQAIFRMNGSVSDGEADAILKDGDSEMAMILAMTQRH